MMSIKVTISSTGTGTDALTQKEGVDGLTVSFDTEPPAFLSWKSFKQLLSLKASQGKPEAKPETRPAAMPMATPANGPVSAVK